MEDGDHTSSLHLKLYSIQFEGFFIKFKSLANCLVYSLLVKWNSY